MEAFVLRQLLVLEWAKYENTPAPERLPTKEQLWRSNVGQLARGEGRPAATVEAELKSKARELAIRDRERILTELARDLAVSRALGQPLESPWKRRLSRLAGVTGLSAEVMTHQVEQRAQSVRVVVQTSP